MSKLRMTNIVAIVVAVALLVAMLPTVVLAATEGGVTGSFQLDSVAPAINSIHVLNLSDNSTASVMTPLTSYRVRINIGDSNTVNDIDQVRVVLRFDAGDTDNSTDPGETGNTNNLVCLKWVKSPEDWTISAGSGTTWALTTGSCSAPSNMGATTGDWDFYVTVGKVGNEAVGGNGADGWDLFGEAWDGTSYTEGMGDMDRGMAWYGEIQVSGAPGFGSVVLGQNQKQSTSPVSATYIANGNFLEQVKSSTATWTNGSDTVSLVTGAPGAGEIKVEADDDATTADAVALTTSYQTIDTGTITSDTGHLQASNYLWLTLGGSAIPSGTYTGTIYYQVGNA